MIGWTLTQSSFSNHYYTRMSEVLYTNANASNVWIPVINPRGPDSSNTLLLKPDVELLYHTFPTTDSPSSSTSTTHPMIYAKHHYCSMFGAFVGHKQCPIQSKTHAIVELYKHNITAFYSNFATAYRKMTEVGYTLTAVDSPILYTYPAQATDMPTIMPTPQPVTSGV